MRDLSKTPRSQFFVVVSLVVVALLRGAAYLRTSETQAISRLSNREHSTEVRAVEQQPIPFDHEAMVQAGIGCLFCHPDATRSPAAGMPSVERCYGCHKVISPGVPAIQQANAYWARQEPIPWVRVNRLPRFVYFTHQVHVAVGLSCERCHGDVGHMTVARQVVSLNMGWCLDCHEQQPNAQQLKDCVVCHQ